MPEAHWPTDRDPELLERAGADGATDDMPVLQEEFRRVEISPGGLLGGLGRSRGEAELVREVMPVAPHHRKRFEGYLPLGPYVLGGEPVAITAGVATLGLTH